MHEECGQKNDVDHALICAKGGFVIMRHNQVRDIITSNFISLVSKDVVVEPLLNPIGSAQLSAATSKENHARLDISCRGFWSPMVRNFFDVRITHADAASHQSSTMSRLLKKMKMRKKRNMLNALQRWNMELLLHQSFPQLVLLLKRPIGSLRNSL